MNARTVQFCITNNEGHARDGSEFEICVQAIEGYELSTAVGLVHDEIVYVGGHGERIDANLLYVDFSVDDRGNLFDQDITGNAGKEQKAEGGVSEYAGRHDDQGFVPQCQFVPEIP